MKGSVQIQTAASVPQMKEPGTYSVGSWVEPKTSRTHFGKCKSFVLAGNRTPNFADHSLVIILTVVFLITLNTVFLSGFGI